MKIEAVTLARETWREFSTDKAPRLAAAIAYSAVFAIAPLIIITIAIAGWYFGLSNGGHGHHIVQEKIVQQISAAMGRDAGATVNGMIVGSYKQHQGLIASLIGWILVLIGASGVFVALEDALNTVWGVEAPRGTIGEIVRNKLTSILMVIGIGIVMLASFLASAALAFVSTYLSALLPFSGMGLILGVANVLVSIAVLGLLFAMILRYLPNAKIAWHDVWFGGFATAVLFEIGQVALSLYLGKSGVSSNYGAAGSVLVILLWAYYSAIVLLLGAELTKVWARRHGSHAALAVPQPAPPITRAAAGVR
jgi:membrane protein